MRNRRRIGVERDKEIPTVRVGKLRSFIQGQKLIRRPGKKNLSPQVPLDQFSCPLGNREDNVLL